MGSKADLSTYLSLSRYLTFSDHNQFQWWKSKGPLLARMLQDGCYEKEQQYHYLIFFHGLVTPALGAFVDPRIGDEGNTLLSGAGKLELSLTFTCNESSVRIAFEPTSLVAGSCYDPFNCHASCKLLSTLRMVDGVQLNSDVYHKLTDSLMLSQHDQMILQTTKHSRVQSLPYKTQNILALNLRGCDVYPTLYVYPQLKAIATDSPVQKMLLDTIRRVDQQGCLSEALTLLEQYFQSLPASTSPMFLSYDLQPLAQATREAGRIFFSETEVEWERISDLWTLSGTQPDPDGLKCLKALWDILRLTPGTRGPGEFPLLFTMELHQVPPFIRPQIGFPMAGQSEIAIAEAAVRFFSYLGWTQYASSYISSLRSY